MMSQGIVSCLLPIPLIFNRQTVSLKDFITANDTIHTGINLQNYYAYDDGTAEAGYNVNPELSSEGYVVYLAVKHEIPYIDTIGGVQIYFYLHIRMFKTKFELMVWNNLNSNAVVFKHTVKTNHFIRRIMDFIRFGLIVPWW